MRAIKPFEPRKGLTPSVRDIAQLKDDENRFGRLFEAPELAYKNESIGQIGDFLLLILETMRQYRTQSGDNVSISSNTTVIRSSINNIVNNFRTALSGTAPRETALLIERINSTFSGENEISVSDLDSIISELELSIKSMGAGTKTKNANLGILKNANLSGSGLSTLKKNFSLIFGHGEKLTERLSKVLQTAELVLSDTSETTLFERVKTEHLLSNLTLTDSESNAQSTFEKLYSSLSSALKKSLFNINEANNHFEPTIINSFAPSNFGYVTKTSLENIAKANSNDNQNTFFYANQVTSHTTNIDANSPSDNLTISKAFDKMTQTKNTQSTRNEMQTFETNKTSINDISETVNTKSSFNQSSEFNNENLTVNYSSTDRRALNSHTSSAVTTISKRVPEGKPVFSNTEDAILSESLINIFGNNYGVFRAEDKSYFNNTFSRHNSAETNAVSQYSSSDSMPVTNVVSRSLYNNIDSIINRLNSQEAGSINLAPDTYINSEINTLNRSYFDNSSAETINLNDNFINIRKADNSFPFAGQSTFHSINVGDLSALFASFDQNTLRFSANESVFNTLYFGSEANLEKGFFSAFTPQIHPNLNSNFTGAETEYLKKSNTFVYADKVPSTNDRKARKDSEKLIDKKLFSQQLDNTKPQINTEHSESEGLRTSLKTETNFHSDTTSAESYIGAITNFETAMQSISERITDITEVTQSTDKLLKETVRNFGSTLSKQFIHSIAPATSSTLNLPSVAEKSATSFGNDFTAIYFKNQFADNRFIVNSEQVAAIHSSFSTTFFQSGISSELSYSDYTETAITMTHNNTKNVFGGNTADFTSKLFSNTKETLIYKLETIPESNDIFAEANKTALADTAQAKTAFSVLLNIIKGAHDFVSDKPITAQDFTSSSVNVAQTAQRTDLSTPSYLIANTNHEEANKLIDITFFHSTELSENTNFGYISAKGKNEFLNSTDSRVLKEQIHTDINSDLGLSINSPLLYTKHSEQKKYDTAIIDVINPLISPQFITEKSHSENKLGGFTVSENLDMSNEISNSFLSILKKNGLSSPHEDIAKTLPQSNNAFLSKLNIIVSLNKLSPNSYENTFLSDFIGFSDYSEISRKIGIDNINIRSDFPIGGDVFKKADVFKNTFTYLAANNTDYSQHPIIDIQSKQINLSSLRLKNVHNTTKPYFNLRSIADFINNISNINNYNEATKNGVEILQSISHQSKAYTELFHSDNTAQFPPLAVQAPRAETLSAAIPNTTANIYTRIETLNIRNNHKTFTTPNSHYMANSFETRKTLNQSVFSSNLSSLFRTIINHIKKNYANFAYRENENHLTSEVSTNTNYKDTFMSLQNEKTLKTLYKNALKSSSILNENDRYVADNFVPLTAQTDAFFETRNTVSEPSNENTIERLFTLERTYRNDNYFEKESLFQNAELRNKLFEKLLTEAELTLEGMVNDTVREQLKEHFAHIETERRYLETAENDSLRQNSKTEKTLLKRLLINNKKTKAELTHTIAELQKKEHVSLFTEINRLQKTQGEAITKTINQITANSLNNRVSELSSKFYTARIYRDKPSAGKTNDTLGTSSPGLNNYARTLNIVSNQNLYKALIRGQDISEATINRNLLSFANIHSSVRFNPVYSRKRVENDGGTDYYRDEIVYISAARSSADFPKENENARRESHDSFDLNNNIETAQKPENETESLSVRTVTERIIDQRLREFAETELKKISEGGALREEAIAESVLEKLEDKIKINSRIRGR